MILAIQQAYYLQARNPSDDAVLIDLAVENGLDRQAFEKQLLAPETQQELEQEMLLARQLGVHSFPSLVLTQDNRHWPVAVDYTSADVMLEALEATTP